MNEHIYNHIEKHIIEHTIPQSAQGSYYTIGFPVPEGVEKLTVSYSYRRLSRNGRRRMVNVADLGLLDQQGRFLGWSGSARKEVFVGPYSSTRGYLLTPVLPGQWSIIVGAYRIPPEGLSVRYEISCTPKAPRWLTGDLHTHSNASDGRYDIYTLAAMALKKGLDFIAVSNHNNYSENLSLPLVPGLTLIPAVEWTHYKGHINFFGLKTPFENSFVANTEEEMFALLASVKKRGAVISVNHPKCSLCPYLWNDTGCFDMVEVWNGPMRRDNLKAAAWWHELLKASGKKIPIVGGSDYHRPLHPVRLGRPVTRVYSETPAYNDILDALMRGHSYITSAKNGPELELGSGSAMMGDTIENSESDAVKANMPVLAIKARKMKPWMRLKLMTSDGAAAQWRPSIKGTVEADLQIQPSWKFAYLIAYRRIFGKDFIRAITNPVYFSR